MEEIKMDRKSLRKFGITMCVCLLIICLIIFMRKRYISIPLVWISGLFLIVGVLFAKLLRPIFIAWMQLAKVLSWVNTRLLLLILFYLLFTPIGLFMRLFGKDPLEREIDKKKDSYWQKKENDKFSALNYERQF